MAREILFKAKRKDNGEWVEGYYYKRIRETKFVDAIEKKVGSVHSVEYYDIDINTLCQFTGLLDKNGNKIWENDVVSTSVGNAIVIYVTERKFDNRYNTGFIVRFADEVSNKNYRHDLVYWIRHDTKCEVIGNIFDNPELLGGADNG